MTLEDELRVIEALKVIPVAQITDDPALFKEILDCLYESHIGGGVFEVNDNNFITVRDFSNWLRTLVWQNKLNAPNGFLESVAGALIEQLYLFR
jgi:hypothetical protein